MACLPHRNLIEQGKANFLLYNDVDSSGNNKLLSLGKSDQRSFKMNFPTQAHTSA